MKVGTIFLKCNGHRNSSGVGVGVRVSLLVIRKRAASAVKSSIYIIQEREVTQSLLVTRCHKNK